MGRYPSFFTREFEKPKKWVTFLLVAINLLSQLTFLEFLIPNIAEAAVVTIDSSVNTTASRHLHAGSQNVFISDQVGYNFYVDSTGICVYSKTTNGGGSWGTAVTVNAGTDCNATSVWYDRWTPGDYGNDIHIVNFGTSGTPDKIYYNRLDTSNDTLLLGSSPVDTAINTSQGATMAAGTNNVTITKATDGVIYVATSDASDSFVLSCASSCGSTSSWNEPGGALFMDLANDWNLLEPLPGGSILLINRSTGLNDIRSRVWNGSSWSGSWDTLDSNAVENGTYDIGMSAVVDPSNGEVILVYATDNDTFTVQDHDIRTAKYSSGSWSTGTDVFTNHPTLGLTSVVASLDINKSEIYVVYSARTTPATATTGNIYYATGTTALSSWGPQNGPVNTTPGDIYGIDVSAQSDERIYASWSDPAPDDIFGETIADIGPVVKVSASGTPTATVTAGSNNVYLGGKFIVKESMASRNVTDVVLSEYGSIDASTYIKNVKLLYDTDTSAPYDCVSESYSGSESQFGVTDTNGFSGSDGVSTFTDSINITPTKTLCLYVVADIPATTTDASVIRLSINNPSTDVLVSGGALVNPISPVTFLASTTVLNSNVKQIHYNWRNDDGTEITATSATGGEDKPILAILKNIPRRLRIEVANNGSLMSSGNQFRLEYGTAAPTCGGITTWTDVGAGSDAWDMYDSPNIVDGNNTTNIASTSGGVTDGNTTFLTPNGGLKDTSSQTGSLNLDPTNFAELEYSIVAATSSVQGDTYCFRVTNAGSPLSTYVQYPSATVSADVTLSATGTQVTNLIVPSTNNYLGGKFVLRENSANRNVTDITITETGTVDGNVGLSNLRLKYDLDTTAPYDCASESYSGSESQFGATSINAFSGPNGSSTFSGSVNITTTKALCVYVITDITSSANNGETIVVGLARGGDDITVSSGSVAPSTSIDLTSTTTLVGSVIAQTNYHWRNDDGSESSSTSATGGVENKPVIDFVASSSIRLRLGITNIGAATSTAKSYTLQFGPKISTCSAVSVWTGVGEFNDDWNMYNSVNVTDGNNTTNIAIPTGGITDGNTNFLSSNGGQKDSSATTTTLTLNNTQFTEFEFSINSTAMTAFNTTYCFRLASDGDLLFQYDNYAELTTSAKRDFKIQRGDTTVTSIGTTIVAGVDYVAPASTSTAFIRITNLHNTGAGKDTLGGAQNARDVTAYISNPENLLSSITFARSTGAINNTRVSWEIIEFIGDPGTDNEMKVRDARALTLASASTTAIGPLVSTVSDNSDVVVFITGAHNRNAGRNLYYTGQFTSSWNASSSKLTLDRGVGGAIADVSYAVVEFTGINWNIQRVEHTYTASGTTETETMNPVNSLARTFIHDQKRITSQPNVNNFGHEVYLSSIGAVTFELEPGATNPSQHTSVAWVIENQQTSSGAMKVQRNNGNTTGGTEPVSLFVTIPNSIAAMNNTSISGNGRSFGANSSFPLAMAGLSLTSTTTLTIWRSEASSAILSFRTEVIEWPINGLAVRQNYYRIYTDNNSIKPTDPWPLGVADLGENTSITAADEPPGVDDVLSLRMTMKVANATLPSGLFDFKLQYGLRLTSCSAVPSWTDLGSATSGVIWRGFNATGTTDGVNLSINPPTPGDLLISVSDIAGSYIKQNPAPANPFPVLAGNDVEYNWLIQDNGALERTTYCFRMVKSDGTTLDGYLNYPQIRTSSFKGLSQNWRWYDDTNTETQVIPLANENVTPIEVERDNDIALRATVFESKHAIGNDIKFRIQYDESPLFTNAKDVTASSSCTATSTWCYGSSTNSDNSKITTRVLSDGDSCVAGVGTGCGTHNLSPIYATGTLHAASAKTEYVFYVRQPAARVGAVYYFRLYDEVNDAPVVAKIGYTYPSLIAESAKLTLSISGLPIGTSTAGIFTTVSTTPSTISFGTIPINTDLFAAHRISVSTNATEGYRVLSYARSQLLNSFGNPINSITGTNANPVSWAVGCLNSSPGCVGYHSTDATLSGTSTRFSALDTYSGLQTSPQEVMYSSIPVSETNDIVYRVKIGVTQPAYTYQTELIYLAVPTY